MTDRASAYRGADLPRARRFTRVFWLIGGLPMLAVMPLYPPTALFGSKGWIIAGIAAGPGYLSGVLLASRKHVGWGGLLVVSYLSLALITLLQALAGPTAHYVVVDLLLVCGVGLVHPLPVAMPYAATMAASRLGLAFLDTHGRTGALVQATLEAFMWTVLAAILCGIMREIREQRLALHDERSVDSLTGLSNRRAFDELLAQEIEEAREGDAPLSLVIADVNGFKPLNDRHGHLAGDRQLVVIADALRQGLRPGDGCFRWGGDEFAALLPGADEQAAARVAERLSLLVAAQCTEPEPLTIGVGLATLRADDDAESLVARADAEMLARKRERGESRRDLSPAAALAARD